MDCRIKSDNDAENRRNVRGQIWISMIEILKDTDQRLVMTLGPAAKRRARFVLDKSSGQAWFERKSFLRSRTVQAGLGDIARVEAAEHRLIVTLKSGARHLYAGDADGVREAAAKIVAFVALASGASNTADLRESGDREAADQSPIDLAQTGPSPSTSANALAGTPQRADHKKRAAQIGIGLGALALLAVAAMKIPDFFILPACDAARTRDTLHDLLQPKAQGPITLSNFTTISRAKTEYRCSAEVGVNGDRATVGYRSYWDGWSAIVRVTGALGMARLDPVRMREIDEAYDAFMARGVEAYQSGEPPRQNEPIVNTQLSTILDVPALSARTLAGADIDEAIRWFNSGDTVGAVYLLAGTGVNDVAQLPADDNVQKKLRANVVRFADEYGRYLDFQVTLLAAIADAQASYATGGPPEEISSADFKRKTADIKALLAQALKTDFISLVYDGLPTDWRLKRLAAIKSVAPIVVKVLPRDELAAIRDQANLTLPYFKDEAVQTRVSEIAGLLGRQDGSLSR